MRRQSWVSWLVGGVGSLGLLLLSAGVFSTLAVTPTQVAQAQDEDEDAGDAGVPDAPAVPPPAVPGVAPETTAPKQSKLAWFIEAMGWVFSITFLALSFIFVAIVVMNLLGARRDNIVPLALVEGFEACLNEKKFQEAYELAKADESFLGHVLAAGLSKLSAGYPQAIEAMQEVGEEENMKLEHRLSYISLIGAISPMVGLLGTVVGMVSAFIVISQSATAPKPAELATGISQALVTTLVGLVLAIPAICIYTILRNRFARLVLEVGILSEGLMSRFQNVGGKKA
ncbi:MAG: MotA/TolQ/ExbB proton channel family protein [Pirellulales bacterium]